MTSQVMCDTTISPDVALVIAILAILAFGAFVLWLVLR